MGLHCPWGHFTTRHPRPFRAKPRAFQQLPHVLLLPHLVFFYATVAKGDTGQADAKKDEKAFMSQKAERLEHILATLPDTEPLREDFQTQLERPRKDLRDPGQPGARLDSAVAKQTQRAPNPPEFAQSGLSRYMAGITHL